MGVACRADLGTRKLGRGFPSQLQLPTLIYLYLKFALRPRSRGQRQHLWFHRFHPASIPSERAREGDLATSLLLPHRARVTGSEKFLIDLARSLWAWLAGWQWVGYGLWNMGWKSSEIKLRAFRCFTYTSPLYVRLPCFTVPVALSACKRLRRAAIGCMSYSGLFSVNPFS